MSEFLEKIESYLFDIIGLIVPGAYFIGCIFVLQVIGKEIPLSEELFLSEIITLINGVYELFKSYLGDYFVFISIVVFFLIGHPVKVFSKAFYQIFGEIFDKILIPKIRQLINWIKGWHKSVRGFINFIGRFLELIYVKKILKNIFTFKASSYYPSSENIYQNSKKYMSSKFGEIFNDEWYPFFKLSTVVINNENISSRSVIYLAKYNLYRSLSFVSLFFSLIVIFSIDTSQLDKDSLAFVYFIKATFLVLWYTFHIKFKRYWTLCGNDALIAFFYYQNRNKFKNE